MSLSLRILGTPELRNQDGTEVPLPLGKTFAVLIYLCCSSKPVSRAEIGTLLWPSATESRRRHSVRQALWIVRNAVGEDLFDGEESLLLKEGALESDLSLFLEALRNGDVSQACILWRGQFLQGLSLSGVRAWDRWVEDLRHDLELRFRRALLQRSEHLRTEGDLVGAGAILETALRVDPESIEVHSARIDALLELGQLDQAREALNDASAVLGESSGWTDWFLPLERKLDELAAILRARRDEPKEDLLEFVGRSKELAALREAWRCVRGGDFRVTLITGPAGIGKTRLVNEFLATVEGAEVQTIRLKGYETESDLEHALFADLVRKLLALPGFAGISSASNAVLLRMLPSLQRGTGPNVDRLHESPVAFVDALVDSLEAVSFEAPLIIILDDAQRVDESSRELILAALRRIKRVPIFFVFLGRAEAGNQAWDRFARGLAGTWPSAPERLKPLTGHEIGELLSFQISWPCPEVHESAALQIANLTDGNPLYVGEILRELREKQILQRDRGGWIFTLDSFPAGLAPPPTLHSLLLHRLDRLSHEAGIVAGLLARSGRQASVASLARNSSIPNPLFDRALSELLDKDIVAWTEGTCVDFSHDLLRETALERYAAEAGTEFSGNHRWGVRSRWGGFLLVLTLLAGTGWALTAQWRVEPPLPPWFGGGMLVFDGPDSQQLRVPVSAQPPSEWGRTAYSVPSPPGIQQIFRGKGGEELWFRPQERPDGPAIARLDSAGIWQQVVGDPLDQTLHDVSPSGSHILFTSQNPRSEEFAHVLRLAQIDGSEPRELLNPRGSISFARFSPDGDRIAVGTRGPADTLVILNLGGERLGSRSLGEIRALDWCDGFLLAVTASQAGFHLLKISPEALSLDTLSLVEIGNVLECSPDGTGVLMLHLREGNLEYAVRDLGNGEMYPLELGSPLVFGPQWVRDSPGRVAEEVNVSNQSVIIPWGESEKVEGWVGFSDGTRTAEGLRWESLDPEVASIDGNHNVIGNRPGEALIVAGWGYSLRDTLRVLVEEGEPPGVVFHERFDSLRLGDWMPIGEPRPRTETDSEGPRLVLTGDDKYSDGIISLFPLSLVLGVTVELEFRLNLTRELHQHFAICLVDGDPSLVDPALGLFSGVGQSLCFRYPSGEGYRLDPAEGLFFVEPGPVEVRIRQEEVLPPRSWAHVALQVQADGWASLILNHQLVSTNFLRIGTQAKRHWILQLDADAVDTEVSVRNLVVWAEPRY